MRLRSVEGLPTAAPLTLPELGFKSGPVDPEPGTLTLSCTAASGLHPLVPSIQEGDKNRGALSSASGGNLSLGGHELFLLCTCLWMPEKALEYWLEITNTF